MSPINPLAGSVAQSTQAARAQTAPRPQRIAELRRLAMREEDGDSEVDSPDAIVSMNDPDTPAGQQEQHRPPPRKRDDDAPDHVDICA